MTSNNNNIINMPLFLENSFSLSNYISISNRTKKIPFYYLHFLPIHSFKNLDEHYKLLPTSKSNLIQREIKHKLIYFQKEKEKEQHFYDNNTYSDTSTDICSTSQVDVNLPFVFRTDNFAKCIYHIFHSCSILHANKISFTMNDIPFVSSDTALQLPLLYDFSRSFYFPIIQSSTFQLYFPESLLYNPYISFEQFLVIYLIHHPNECWREKDTNDIIELFSSSREKIQLNTKNILKSEMIYFRNYHSDHIIQHMLQFKYNWSYYSLCYFFIEYYSDLLRHFSLHDLFHSYIHSSYKLRNSNIVDDIHKSLFTL